MKYKKGDLLREAKDYDFIIHGCNCFNTFGAGIALGIKQKYPQAHEQDLKTISGDKNKLGTFTEYKYDEFTVINAYCQYGYGRIERGMTPKESKLFREDAIRLSFRNIYEKYGNKDYKFAYPLLGSNLAGGKWERISKIINEEMKDSDMTCIVWEKDKVNLNKFNL